MFSTHTWNRFRRIIFYYISMITKIDNDLSKHRRILSTWTIKKIVLLIYIYIYIFFLTDGWWCKLIYLGINCFCRHMLPRVVCYTLKACLLGRRCGYEHTRRRNYFEKTATKAWQQQIEVFFLPSVFTQFSTVISRLEISWCHDWPHRKEVQVNIIIFLSNWLTIPIHLLHACMHV